MSVVEIIEDESHPEGGFAAIRIRGRAIDAGRQPTLTIRHATRQKDSCLGPEGWQSGEHYFHPRTVTVSDGDLILTVGPDIVDEVEEYTPIVLAVPDLGISEDLRWPPLLTSMESGFVTGSMARTAKPPPAAPKPAPPPPMAEPPAPEPDAPPIFDAEALLGERKRQLAAEPDPEATAASAWPPAPLDQAPETNEATLPMGRPAPEPRDSEPFGETRDSEEPARRPAWLWIVGGAILALIIAVVLAVVFWDSSSDPAVDPTETETPTTIRPPDDTPGFRPSTPAERHLLADAALEAGDADAAVPLLRENANAGYGPSMLSLAEYYQDEDPGESMRLLTQACARGVEGASAALERFKAHLEQLQQDGSAMADLILREDYPKAASDCPR